MKKRLLKMLQAKEEARRAAVEKSKITESVEELRSINAGLEVLNAENCRT